MRASSFGFICTHTGVRTLLIDPPISKICSPPNKRDSLVFLHPMQQCATFVTSHSFCPLHVKEKCERGYGSCLELEQREPLHAPILVVMICNMRRGQVTPALVSFSHPACSSAKREKFMHRWSSRTLDSGKGWKEEVEKALYII